MTSFRSTPFLLTAIAASALCGARAMAADPAPARIVDKSAYSFANPTLDELLRELSTDRPDATESPFTVDAGRVQIEMDFANFTHDRRDGARTAAWEVAPFNLRFGVRSDVELGVFVSPWSRVAETPRSGPREIRSGFGDVGLRGKINFWGNDSGPTALGLILDLTLPTAAEGLGARRAEGAVTLPVAFELAGGWEGGAMTTVQLRARETTGYRAVWANTATLGHDIAGPVGGYVELTSEAGDGPHVCTLNFGLTWRIGRHQQFDAGVNLGVSRAAADAQVFSGFSRRF